jgi:hypothetical protein
VRAEFSEDPSDLGLAAGDVSGEPDDLHGG